MTNNGSLNIQSFFADYILSVYISTQIVLRKYKKISITERIRFICSDSFGTLALIFTDNNELILRQDLSQSPKVEEKRLNLTFFISVRKNLNTFLISLKISGKIKKFPTSL